VDLPGRQASIVEGDVLRGAQEIANFVDELGDQSEPGVVIKRRAILDAIAQTLNIPGADLERTFEEIAEDPYTEFLRSVWQQPTEAEEAEEAERGPVEGASARPAQPEAPKQAPRID
jgi:hypothetical protein